MFLFISSLKTPDFFPVSTSLKHNGWNYYRTHLGFFFSLVLLSLTFAFSVSNLENFFYRLRPSIKKNEYYQNSKINFFPIDYQHFPLMFGLSDFDNATFFINEQVYLPKAEVITFRKEQDGVHIEKLGIACIPCQREYLETLSTSDFFLKQNYQALYCLQNQAKTEIERMKYIIGGAYEEEIFSFFRLSFGICESNCEERKVIEEKLRRGYASVFFEDYMEDLDDEAQPLKPFGKGNVFTTFGMNYTKGIDVNFLEMQIVSDKGLVFEEKEEEVGKSFENLREFFEPVTTPAQFMYFDFKMSHKKVVFSRNYMKFQEFIADIGGLINLLYLFFWLLVYPFSKIRYYVDLLNDVFDLREGGVRRGGWEEGWRKEEEEEGGRDEGRRRRESGWERGGKDEEGRMMTEEESILNRSVLMRRKNLRISKSIFVEREEEEGRMNEKKEKVITKKKEEDEESRREEEGQEEKGWRMRMMEVDKRRRDEEERRREEKEIWKDKEIVKKEIKEEDKQNFHRSSKDSISEFKSEGCEYNILEKPPPRLPFLKKEVKYEDLIKEEILKLEDIYLSFPDDENNKIKGERILEDKKFVKKSILHKKVTIQFDSERKGNELLMSKKSEDPNQEFLMMKPETEIIKLNFFGYFRFYFSKFFSTTNSSSLLLQEGTSKIEEALDVRNILKKLYEIDKLKSILLDNDQLILFNNLAKPNLSKLNREVLESRKDRYKAFARVKERKNKKDRRLMVLLDERMKVEWERREILKSRIL